MFLLHQNILSLYLIRNLNQINLFMIRRIMTTWHFGHVCAVLMEFEDFYTVVKIGATESQI